MPSTKLKHFYNLGNKICVYRSSILYRNLSTHNNHLEGDQNCSNSLKRSRSVLFKNCSLLSNYSKKFSTSIRSNQLNRVDTDTADAKLHFVDGFVKLIVYLPGRREKCEFTLKPINDTVKDLVEYIKLEDKSIEKVQLNTLEGVRLAQNTSIGHLVTQPFVIKINDASYNVEPPLILLKNNDGQDDMSRAKNDLEEIRQLVSKLYLHLNVEQFESEREEKILKKLELLKSELEPMEKTREQLALKAKKHTNRMIWLGLGLMSVQVGILARLTWFDYSWDIVEPISYFVSYSAVIGVYAYFVLTRKEYDYESASDRIFLRHLHKNAIKENLNIDKYNELKNLVFILENDLKKIKDSQLKSLTKIDSSNLEIKSNSINKNDIKKRTD